MQFRTKIPISNTEFKIEYNSKILSLGSCFAVNIGNKFDFYKFQNTTNPFGIIFNPVSIEKIIHKALSQEPFTEKDVFFHNARWHCFDVHSDLSNSNKEALLDNLNQLLQSTKQQLQEASHIVITYGTSWVYRKIDSTAIVANCHKVPQKEFTKVILSVETVSNAIRNTIESIQKTNPKCKIIFTVSPVRHLKDGFVENQLSKAHLIAAIHSTHNSQLTTHSYFPSYEILMDELRDYRFYAEDMVHPNQVAIDYIWQRFAETTISPESISVMEEVASIQKGLAHRPFNPESESHKKFEVNQARKITSLIAKYPFMKF